MVFYSHMLPSPRETFENVYQKLSLPVKKFLIKKTHGDQNAAEEVFARTWSAAWQGFSKFHNKSSYFTWICRIGLNKIADYWHDQINDNSRWVAPFFKELGTGDTHSLTPEELTSLSELRTSLRECMNLLPENKRRLLQFRFWYQWSLKEMSEHLGISERAVEGRLYRAKQLLKKVLHTHHPELAPHAISIHGRELR